MSNHVDLLDVIGSVYEAGAEPSQWPFALDRLARMLQAPIAGLLYHDVARNSGQISEMIGADPEGTTLYNTHYHALDPWVGRAQSSGLIQTGIVMSGDEIVSRQELRRTEYYNEFALRYNGTRLLAGIVMRTGSIFSNLSVLAGEEREPFGADEKRLLSAVIPHLQRAIDIHRRMDVVRSVNAAALEALDRVPFGVILLDGSGRMLAANQDARRILKEAEAIRFRAGLLRATIASEDATLQQLIRDAAFQGQRERPAIGAATILSRPAGKPPLQLLVTPLQRTTAFAESHRVAVFLTDPSRRSVPPTELLRVCFGFSSAETGVVRGLLEGLNVKEISGALSLTENTVRSYLKTILSKTGCRSQSSLVALVLRSVSALRRLEEAPPPKE